MKHDVFLNGKTVDLVVLELKHVKKTDWYKWLNNQKLTTYTKQGYFPNTKEKQLKYFLDNLHKKKELNKKFSEDKKLQLGIINKKTNKFVGVISLFRFDYFSRCCEISILINFEKLNNSMKVYKEAQDLLIKHAFFKMNFRRIQTSTFSSELSDLAIRLFGFKLEGIQKEREYVNGKYHDLYLLGLLKNYYVSN
tara:strand:- start:880 stop:1461 length:582 start_codon:yes stop_codon:yes gene_type:complete